ncbi:hypothetical protein [Streptomyces sp. NPDC001530]|uniref:hypothetical protein n=1 Tax=Streptomyces sp. NPDC001530 TaxID=3364582 RepID=UPI0036C8A08C
MPPTPPASGSARSAAVLNGLIRALWPHPSMRLTDEERRLYAELVTEWTVAVARERCEVVEAA